MEKDPGVRSAELVKYQPKFMIFLGRHGEESHNSIFDQVGGENGKISDNFEESSLTLKGILETHLRTTDILRSVSEKVANKKIKIVLGVTGAYRTQETVGIIKENLEKEAKVLGLEVDVDIAEPSIIGEITEKSGEDMDQSRSDIDTLVGQVQAEAAGSLESIVFLGITHEAKLRNYLNSLGMEVDNVENSEFLSVADNDKTNLLSFRGDSQIIPKS